LTLTGRAVTADGVGLWWRLDGLGPTVLLVPGRGDATDVYPDEFSSALVAAGCSVLRVDPRDTGLSDAGGDAYTLTTMAADLDAVAADASVGAVHVVALSMGGMVTVDLAIRHPSRVASIVFVGAMSPDPDAGMGPRFFDGLGADPVLGTLASMGSAGPIDEAWMRERAARAHERAPARPTAGVRHQDAALRLGWPAAADLAAVAVPVLVVHGARDLVLPAAHADALVAGIPGARAHLVEGMGHLPTRREWLALAALVAGHVAAASSLAVERR
jgi:pimeloyl-ACP methyl ester carboxylesterase